MLEQKRIGRYKLIEVAGQGEILILYRAHDTERNWPVLLKVVHPHLRDDAGLIDRFRREAERLARLRHSHIVPVRDVRIQEAVLAASDIPAGESLERRLASRGPLAVDDVLTITSQLADALDYAHAQAVFHHDLRPANIYLDGPTARLTNFCLLEAVGATPAYMAPEQLDENSARVADRRSDTYALSAVIYEMLVGRPPFRGEMGDAAAAHLRSRPTSPRVFNPGLPPALDAILFKALSRQPQTRYLAASDLAAAMREAVQIARTLRMSDQGVFDKQERSWAVMARLPGRMGDVPVWVWVGVVILLVVVISAVILLAT